MDCLFAQIRVHGSFRDMERLFMSVLSTRRQWQKLAGLCHRAGFPFNLKALVLNKLLAEVPRIPSQLMPLARLPKFKPARTIRGVISRRRFLRDTKSRSKAERALPQHEIQPDILKYG